MWNTSENNWKIFSALNKFFKYYLCERNAEKTLTMVTEDIYSIGTGIQEVALGKVAFKELLDTEMAILSTPIKYKILNYNEKEIAEGISYCFCDVITTLTLEDSGVNTFKTRLTSGFRMIDNEYLAFSFHMSEASEQQKSEEFFPLRFKNDAEEQIRHQTYLELLDLMKELLPGGIMGCYLRPDLPLYVINDELLDLLGYDYKEFECFTERKMSNIIFPEDLKYVLDLLEKSFLDKNSYTLRYRIQRKDGSYFWVQDLGKVILSENGEKVSISVITDISEEVEHEKTLKKQADQDSLTRLLNRRVVANQINAALLHVNNYGFVILDIDEFKHVNDTYGHIMGDQVLTALGEILHKLFGETGILGRLGGDEFVIFVPNPKSSSDFHKQIYALEQLYKEKLSILCPDETNLLSGGGLLGNDTTTFDQLYKKADDILYEVKRTQKGKITIIKKE